MSSENVLTPWSKRAEELAEKEGPWRQYAAWEDWFQQQKGLNDSDGATILDLLEFDDKVTLYCAFERACGR